MYNYGRKMENLAFISLSQLVSHTARQLEENNNAERHRGTEERQPLQRRY